MSRASRYDRQIRVASFGTEGQDRLLASRVAIIGVGALGSRVAEDLARSGVGYIRLVDRDFVELGNLHRQHLYDEHDAEREEPKVLAAAARLSTINSDIEIDARLADLDAAQADALLDGVDLVIDGTDNFRTRYLVNDWSVREQRPWIYGACVGTEAMAAAFLPGRACLRCMFPEPPPAESTATCETAGILPPAVALATTLQTMLAFSVLTEPGSVPTKFYACSTATGEIRSFDLPSQSAAACPACALRTFPALDVDTAGDAQVLCGRNAVQLTTQSEHSLEALAERFRDHAPELRKQMLRIDLPEGRITVFRGGRAIVQGTDDIARARALFDRYIGD
ncbi:MAG: ThiF family adenylyltransferase [Planctomycetes bacterium]|nr:ThiF family adenylyltransferase [Planctomycetota bacterium]